MQIERTYHKDSKAQSPQSFHKTILFFVLLAIVHYAPNLCVFVILPVPTGFLSAVVKSNGYIMEFLGK